MAGIDPQRIALELDVDVDKVKALVNEGLTEEQIHALLTNPMAVIEWVTETTVEGDAVFDPDGSLTRAAAEAQEGSGGTRQGLLPRPTGRGTVRTVHKGSTFGHETSRLTMATEFAWDRFVITSARVSEHRSKKTWWGSAAGYHVDPSYEGSSGWIHEPSRYRTEVKADWKVVAHHKDFEIESGTAWIQHLVNGFGLSQVEKGGWSY